MTPAGKNLCLAGKPKRATQNSGLPYGIFPLPVSQMLNKRCVENANSTNPIPHLKKISYTRRFGSATPILPSLTYIGTLSAKSEKDQLLGNANVKLTLDASGPPHQIRLPSNQRLNPKIDFGLFVERWAAARGVKKRLIFR
jgi:hypothetical protein